MISALEAIIAEAGAVPAYLPNVRQLMDAVKKAKEWLDKVESVQVSEGDIPGKSFTWHILVFIPPQSSCLRIHKASYVVYSDSLLYRGYNTELCNVICRQTLAHAVVILG